MSPLRRTASSLVLFSQSFPYDVALEDSFLLPELPHLAARFERLIIVPAATAGGRSDVPPDVEVDEGLATTLATVMPDVRSMTRGVLSSVTRTDLRTNPLVVLRPGAARRLLGHAARADVTAGWFRSFQRRHGLSPGRTLAYSFWLDFSATAMVLVRRRQPELVAVARAHGGDLYAERYRPPYLPARRLTLEGLDAVFPDSAAGAAYLRARFPWYRGVETARMGVPDPGSLNPAPEGGTLRFVSCSRVVPIKRVDRIVAAIDRLARSHPDRQVEWRHFGEGELLADIRAAAAGLPPNARVHLDGYPSLDGVRAFYREQPVNAFINTSESEGTPVAIMEAISAGIPVVATNVGGNPEIVTADNGVLISADATAAELVDALLRVAEPQNAERLRIGSRKHWATYYDADANLSRFADRLVALRETR